MNKPIITFCEPYEIFIMFIDKDNNDKLTYLQETSITEDELLLKYDIDYASFFRSNIRDEKGFLEILKSKHDIHIFLLNYINN